MSVNRLTFPVDSLDEIATRQANNEEYYEAELQCV